MNAHDRSGSSTEPGDALARRAASALRHDVDRRVDVDAALAAVLTDDGARVLPLAATHDPSSGRPERRAWLGAAAAVLLIGAGSLAFALTRDDDARVVPADATDPSPVEVVPTTPPSPPGTNDPPPDTSAPAPDTSPAPTLTTVVQPPASAVDALEGLVAPDPLDPVEVPAYLPSAPVAERSQVQLRQFSEPIETVSRLVQTWGSEAGQVLEVTTSLGGDPTLLFESEESFGWEVSEVDVWPWDEAVVASANAEQVQLRDPSGTVRLNGFGFTSDELVTIATGMTLTPGGWALASTADAGLIELNAGWTRTAYATRIMQWDTGTVRGEVMVMLGAPGGMLSVNNETSAVLADVRGAPTLVTELGTGTVASWSPAPDVVVVLGFTGSVDEALALARSLEPVDAATWRSAGIDVTSEADGCDSFFFC